MLSWFLWETEYSINVTEDNKIHAQPLCFPLDYECITCSWKRGGAIIINNNNIEACISEQGCYILNLSFFLQWSCVFKEKVHAVQYQNMPLIRRCISSQVDQTLGLHKLTVCYLQQDQMIYSRWSVLRQRYDTLGERNSCRNKDDKLDKWEEDIMSRTKFEAGVCNI